MRIGIWGTSQITNFHIDALARIPGIEIVALHGTHLKSGEIISRNKKIPFLPNFEEFIGLKPDLIVITNSVDKHWSSIKKIMDQDIFIVCEKPLLANRKEFDEFNQTLKQKKLQLSVVSQKKYDPEFIEFEKKVKNLQGKKNIKLVIRKKRDKAYFENQSPSKHLAFSQLPHALDLVMALSSSEIKLEKVQAKKMSNQEHFDFLHLTFVGDNFFAAVEIESFHPENYPLQMTIENQNKTFRYPAERNWFKRVLNKRKNKDQNTIGDFQSMYSDFFQKFKQHHSMISEITHKADLLTNVMAEMSRNEIQ